MIENDDAEVHCIFPTAIYTARLNDYKKLNKTVLDNIDPYLFDTSYNDSVLGGGWKTTGEYEGKIDLHMNDKFDILFKQIAQHARAYVRILGMKDYLFDYYIHKTWLSLITDSNSHITPHIHSNSDISFVYYLEAPAGSDCISFSNKYRPNELFRGMMDDNRPEEKTFYSVRNQLNYTSFNIMPNEGLLVMWPGSTLMHGTVENTYVNEKPKGRRNGLSGDISLVLKPKLNSYESGRVSLDLMKKFV
jgi:uncharacterized protein (TIGR02466 family)